MSTYAEVEQRIRNAAERAAFLRFRIARTDREPHMYDNVRFYAVVIQYDTTQVTALTRAVATMLADLQQYGMQQLCGFIAAQSYYVVVIDTQPHAEQRAQSVPASASKVRTRNGNGNGNTQRRRTKLTVNDLPQAIKSFERWLSDVGRQYLAHSDEELIDYELDAEGEETNELYVYMESAEHGVTFKYIIGFDDTLAVTDITSVHTNECRACIYEARDNWPDRPV